MLEKQADFNIFTNLKFIPQVMLLFVPAFFVPIVTNNVLKKIICQKQPCQDVDLCFNCQKLKDNNYFDLIKYQFNKNNIMKKQDVSNIIDKLSYQSLEDNNPKICVLENIEYSSIEANAMFLKFLEKVPNNTFLIFISANIKKILPTIKSRCQIISLSNQEINLLKEKILSSYNQFQAQLFLIINHDVNDFDYFTTNLPLLLNLIKKFINNDNLNQDNNFLLIKELLPLKEKIILFFQLLLKLSENKLAILNHLPTNNHPVIVEINESWKNNNQLFLNHTIELIITTVNKIKQTNNINLNLLLNYFFIKLYQGYKND